MEYLDSDLKLIQNINNTLSGFSYDETNWDTNLKSLDKLLEPYIPLLQKRINAGEDINSNINGLTEELTPIFEEKFPGIGEAVATLIVSKISLESKAFQTVLGQCDLEKPAVFASLDPLTISVGVSLSLLTALLYKATLHAPLGLKKVLSATLAIIMTLTLVIGSMQKEVTTDESINNKLSQIKTYIIPALDHKMSPGEDPDVFDYRLNVSKLIINNTDLYFSTERSRARYDAFLRLLINLSNKASSLSIDNKSRSTHDTDNIDVSTRNFNVEYLNELSTLNKEQIQIMLFNVLDNSGNDDDSNISSETAELKQILEDNQDIRDFFINYLKQYFISMSQKKDVDSFVLIDDIKIIKQFFLTTFSSYTKPTQIINDTKALALRHNLDFATAFNITKISMRTSSSADFVPKYDTVSLDNDTKRTMIGSGLEDTYNLIEYFRSKYDLSLEQSAGVVNVIIDNILKDSPNLSSQALNINSSTVLYISSGLNNDTIKKYGDSYLGSNQAGVLTEIPENRADNQDAYISKAQEYISALGLDDSQIDYTVLYSNYLLVVSDEDYSAQDFQNYAIWYISTQQKITNTLLLVPVTDQQALTQYLASTKIYENGNEDEIISNLVDDISTNFIPSTSIPLVHR